MPKKRSNAAVVSTVLKTATKYYSRRAREEQALVRMGWIQPAEKGIRVSQPAQKNVRTKQATGSWTNCPVCGIKVVKLERHMRKMHEIPGVRPIQ